MGTLCTCRVGQCRPTNKTLSQLTITMNHPGYDPTCSRSDKQWE